MSRWGTIFLLLLTAAAAVFLFVVEPRLQSTRDEEAVRESLLGLNPAVIRGIRIRTGDRTFEINLQRDGWWISPQPKDRASHEQVMALLEAAAKTRSLDVIRAGELREGRDLEEFGLAEPKSQIDFIGDGMETLYFGKEAASAGRMYVRIGESRDVHVVNDELQKLAAREPAEFRDRRLSAYVPGEVDAFTIRRGTGEIELVRGAKGWEILRPLRTMANDSRVNQVLETVLGARILEFVADESNDLGAYGLAEPRAEIVLTVEGVERPLTLRVGGDVPNSDGRAVVAQYTGRDCVYHLPSEVWEALQVTPDALRDRRLTSLNLDTIDAIRIEQGGNVETIEREGDAWRDSRGPLTDEQVGGFVDALNGTLVEEYAALSPAKLAETGLDAPRAHIFFDAWLSENTPEATAGRHPVLDIAIGKADEGRVWVRVGDAPEICAIPADSFDLLPGVTEKLNTSEP
jgi:hypothetical protein